MSSRTSLAPPLKVTFVVTSALACALVLIVTGGGPGFTPTVSAARPEPAQAEDEGDAGGYEYRDEGEVRRALEQTLAQPDFARLRAEPEKEKEPEESKSPEWLDRFLRWLGGLLGEGEQKERSTSSTFSFAGMQTLLFAMAVLILVAAIVFIGKSVLVSARDRKTAEEEERARMFQPGTAPGEIPPDEYWRRALAHGDARRYREGIRELLLGAMSTTERRGLIRFRKGLTNRDYLYAARGTARDSFGRIASAFELVYFGRRDATVDAFRECCREYERSFGAVNA